MNSHNENIQEAKARLPLPKLMEQFNLGEHAKKSAHCPFHDDQYPSFSVFQNADGQWFWKCFASCGEGDEITFLEKFSGKPKGEVIRLYCEMAGVQIARPVIISVPKQTKSAQAEPRPVVTPRPLPELLSAIRDVVRTYVSFQFPEQATAIALWVAHTWVLDAFYYTPYLHVFSAETSSGKSRLLEVLALLVNKPWKLESASVAAIFRRIAKDQITLLYDEIDNVFRGNGKDDDTKDLRACFNSGFKRDGKFSRCVGQNANLEVMEFATFAPKALAGIGKVLSDTLSNRCIPIELVRQTREEKVKRFREREAQAQLRGLRAEIEAWSQHPGVIDALRDAETSLPDELTDRQQDIAEPLLAIADMAGEGWPELTRAAIIKLCQQSADVVSTGVQLLRDMKQLFDEAAEAAQIADIREVTSIAGDKLTTREIIEGLIAIEGSPWALMFEEAVKFDRWQSAASRLAKMLRLYKTPDGRKIEPHSIKLDSGSVVRGYHKADFMEEWERYLPSPGKTATGATSATNPQGATEITKEGSGSSGSSGSTEVQGIPTTSDNDADPLQALPTLSEKAATGATIVGKKVAAGRAAERVLANLVDRIEAATDHGLHPKGHPDCPWGHDSARDYPAEYTSAVSYLDCKNGGSEEAAFDELSSLVYKIECEARRGTPLVANGDTAHEWTEGSYPPEFEAARTYVRQKFAEVERELQAT